MEVLLEFTDDNGVFESLVTGVREVEEAVEGVEGAEESADVDVPLPPVSASLCNAGLCFNFFSINSSAPSSLTTPLEYGYSAQEVWTSDKDIGVLFSRDALSASKQNRQCSTVAMSLDFG